MANTQKILVLGASGLIGSHFVEKLSQQSKVEILAPNRSDLDLLNQKQVSEYFEKTHPDIVILAAGKVGGIIANSKLPYEFLYENLMIQSNVFSAALNSNIEKLTYFCSSCAYPEVCPQPMVEESLFSGEPYSGNFSTSMAKRAGVSLIQAINYQHKKNYLALIPPTIYGPGDKFNENDSHVISGMITRIHKVMKNNEKTFEVWGTGKALREFMYVTDLVEATLFLINMEKKHKDFMNIGADCEVSIAELAKIIADQMGFRGEIVFNTNMPEGVLRKKLDTTYFSKFNWKSKVSLESGIAKTIESFKNTIRD